MKTKCPNCGIEYEIDDSLFGRKLECNCGATWFAGESLESGSANASETQLSPDNLERISKRNNLVWTIIAVVLVLLGIMLGIEKSVQNAKPPMVKLPDECILGIDLGKKYVNIYYRTPDYSMKLEVRPYLLRDPRKAEWCYDYRYDDRSKKMVTDGLVYPVKCRLWDRKHDKFYSPANLSEYPVYFQTLSHDYQKDVIEFQFSGVWYSDQDDSKIEYTSPVLKIEGDLYKKIYDY